MGCTYGEPEGPCDPGCTPGHSSYTRQRSQTGFDNKRTRQNKSLYCKSHGTWPWWIKHDSELTYWTDPLREGFEVDAVRWRWAQEVFLSSDWTARDGTTKEEALKAYNEEWIRIYGEKANTEALKASQAPFEKAKRDYPSYPDFQRANPIKRGPDRTSPQRETKKHKGEDKGKGKDRK